VDFDGFMAKLPTWAGEANALADEVTTNADVAAAAQAVVEPIAADIAALGPIAAAVSIAAAIDAEIVAVAVVAGSIPALAAVDDDIAALGPITADITTAADNIAAIVAAPTAAVEAAASAVTAVNAPGTSAASTTELTIGTGAKTLSIQTGKSLVVGMAVVIAESAAPTNQMYGTTTGYNTETGELIVDVTIVGGSGTAAAWTVSLSGPAFTGGTITGPLNVDAPVAQGITAVAALDIDCSNGNYFTKTISGNSTFTFSNPPAARSYGFTLELTHTSGTVTWPATVKWPKDTTPILTTGKTHLFMLVTDDGGTRWRGAALADYVA
jgi:hypothetical protein